MKYQPAIAPPRWAASPPAFFTLKITLTAAMSTSPYANVFKRIGITKNNKTVASGIRRAAAMMIPKTPALAPMSGISGSFERSPGIITRPLVDSVTINPAKFSRR